MAINIYVYFYFLLMGIADCFALNQLHSLHFFHKSSGLSNFFFLWCGKLSFMHSITLVCLVSEIKISLTFSYYSSLYVFLLLLLLPMPSPPPVFLGILHLLVLHPPSLEQMVHQAGEKHTTTPEYQ